MHIADMDTERPPHDSDSEKVFFRFPTTLSENAKASADWRPGQGLGRQPLWKEQWKSANALSSPFAIDDEQADE